MPAAEPITVEMLERWLEEQIEETRKSRASPLPDPNLRADHVCYNITTQTCCWDFCCCLVDMEMTRVREGAPAPLKIGFVSGPQDPLKFHSTFQEMMFRKVRRPMLGLLGAVESNRAKYGRRVRVRGYGPVSAAARAGEPVP